MKNIKQSIKNKAKATGEFISDHADIIIPVATATVAITCAVLKVKSNNKIIKEQEDIIIVQSDSDERMYQINSETTSGDNGWVNWGGTILANHNQDQKELLEQMISDINDNKITIEEV